MELLLAIAMEIKRPDWLFCLKVRAPMCSVYATHAERKVCVQLIAEDCKLYYPRPRTDTADTQ